MGGNFTPCTRGRASTAARSMPLGPLKPVSLYSLLSRVFKAGAVAHMPHADVFTQRTPTSPLSVSGGSSVREAGWGVDPVPCFECARCGTTKYFFCCCCCCCCSSGHPLDSRLQKTDFVGCSVNTHTLCVCFFVSELSRLHHKELHTRVCFLRHQSYFDPWFDPFLLPALGDLWSAFRRAGEGFWWPTSENNTPGVARNLLLTFMAKPRRWLRGPSEAIHMIFVHQTGKPSFVGVPSILTLQHSNTLVSRVLRIPP